MRNLCGSVAPKLALQPHLAPAAAPAPVATGGGTDIAHGADRFKNDNVVIFEPESCSFLQIQVTLN